MIQYNQRDLLYEEIFLYSNQHDNSLKQNFLFAIESQRSSHSLFHF